MDSSLENSTSHLRHEFELSVHPFWTQGSDKRPSAQYLRPNLQPIYQEVGEHGSVAGLSRFLSEAPWSQEELAAITFPEDFFKLPGKRHH